MPVTEGTHCFQKLLREVLIWNALKHPNILELHGVIIEKDNPLPLLVSQFMENGTADEYARLPEANILHMARPLLNTLDI